MTPVEIFEYKQQWTRNHHYEVRLHSDLRSQGKDFCKTMMFKHQWDLKIWSDVYEDTFKFEMMQDAKLFKEKFSKYADMPN